MSTYCAQADIEAVFGPDNLDGWADLDNDDDATKIAARIAWGIGVASEEVDDYLRNTYYHIPLATLAGVTPTSIKHIAAKLAGVLIYECRGVEDLQDGQPVHQLMWARQSAYQALDDIKSGKRRIDAQ